MIQNYEIMSGDTLVALWENGKFTVVCKNFCRFIFAAFTIPICGSKRVR